MPVTSLLTGAWGTSVEVIGHRGNTRAWFIRYVRAGANGVEVDLDLVNGKLVLTHRYYLDEAYSLREKLSILIKSIHLRKPLVFDEALSLACKAGVKLLVDIKNGQAVRYLAEELKAHRNNVIARRLVFISRRYTDLMYLKRTFSNITTLLSIDGEPPPVLDTIKDLGISGLSINYRYITKSIAQKIKKHNLIIALWNVQKPEQVYHIMPYTDMIITDNINIIKMFSQIKPRYI